MMSAHMRKDPATRAAVLLPLLLTFAITCAVIYGCSSKQVLSNSTATASSATTTAEKTTTTQDSASGYRVKVLMKGVQVTSLGLTELHSLPAFTVEMGGDTPANGPTLQSVLELRT